MLRLLILIAVFYVVYKAIRVFVKIYLISSADTTTTKKNNPKTKSKDSNKYKNVQEVEYTEIKDEEENGKE